MTAQELKTAATRLRTIPAKATHGTTEWIALVHIPLAEALADWLEAEAIRLAHGVVPEQHESLGRNALAVARVINGSGP